MAARVKVIHEVCPGRGDGWALALQWCRYEYEDGTSEKGYRFIWRRPGGNLQPARGQARIPSLAHAEKLMKIARSEGWGQLDGD